ncbi:peptide MFS transporter [Hymenobacter actinosclerus]|uniref:Proton-dependent oligopeptide transporter, POT family n=1 Tax=Hymenobacter actinosclerus TaxID=82805 RepID=A0A1I0DML3_9BACT|nr:peptide MFS transporter [Hymenobacter actinosclerus]SET32927.1 proton-dependent oligopeptide transporter, POT family [Hymenobacter actinosclerus]
MHSPSAAQQLVSTSSSHPKGLYVLFATEMWERFSYYGMRALLILYMTQALVFDKEYSSLIYGNYTSLVYLTPLLGGYVADRYWGNRRSILIGGLMMALGQFALFFSASMYVSGQATAPQMQLILFLLGLGLLIFGNGFFKPNISSMVGSLYPAGDSRIDSAYTIFYMGINLGAFFSPLVCGTLGNTGHPEDFKWGFLAAGIGMLVGSLTFELFKNKYVVTADGSALGAKPEQAVAQSPVVPVDTDGPVRAEAIDQPAAKSFASKLPMLIGLFVVVYGAIAWLMSYDWVGAFVFAAMIVTPVAVLADDSLTTRERQKIYVILILSFFVIFFWGAFEQAGASLTFFADEQTNRQLGSYTVPASYFQSANALFIILFAPVFALVWTFMGKRGIEPSSPLKMSIGLMFLAIGYLIIAFGVKGVDASTKVSMFWLITMYLMHTFGELCLSPIGLALVNKLAPLRFASLLMAVWFLATAAGNKFAGVLSALYPEPGKPAPFFVGFEITGLYEFFMIFVGLSAAASLVLFVIYRKLTQMMAEPVNH